MIDRVVQVHAVEQEASGIAIIEHQLHPLAYQLAEIGRVVRGVLANKQLGLAKGLVGVPVAAGDTHFQTLQVVEVAERIGAVLGVEQHQFDLR